MRTSKVVKLQEKLLAPLAESVGLHYYTEVLSPSPGLEQNAFHFATCGATLLAQLADPESFPSEDQRTSRKGAKAVARAYAGEGGRRASIFLAHALACFIYETQLQGGHRASAEAHLGFRDTIQRVFPLAEEDLALVELCRAEHEVMRTRVPNRNALLGIGGTRFHLALQDPDQWGDPDDPETIEAQRRYANGYLPSMANLYAIEMVIGKTMFADIEAELSRPDGAGMGALKVQLQSFGSWGLLVEEWTRYAGIALGPVSSERQVFEDPLSQTLQERTLQRFGALLDEAWLPEPALAEAIRRFATDTAGNQEDWLLALECIYFGYFLRNTECDTTDWNSFDQDYSEHLARISQEDPVRALATGASTAVKSLPGVFGPSEVVWHEVRDWACQEALERAKTREELGRETRNEPPMPVERCREAFDYGYGLGLAEEGCSHVMNDVTTTGTEQTADRTLYFGPCQQCQEAGRLNQQGQPNRLRLTRSRKSNKRFVACEGYPECDDAFGLPQRGGLLPHEEICSICGNAPRLKWMLSGRSQLICLNQDCPSMEEFASKAEARRAATAEAHIRPGVLVCGRSSEVSVYAEPNAEENIWTLASEQAVVTQRTDDWAELRVGTRKGWARLADLKEAP